MGCTSEPRTRLSKSSNDMFWPSLPRFHDLVAAESASEIPAADCLITGSIDLLVKESQDGSIRDAEVIDFKAMEAGSDPFADPNLIGWPYRFRFNYMRRPRGKYCRRMQPQDRSTY